MVKPERAWEAECNVYSNIVAEAYHGPSAPPIPSGIALLISLTIRHLRISRLQKCTLRSTSLMTFILCSIRPNSQERESIYENDTRTISHNHSRQSISISTKPGARR
jgi:hypothetical protein